MTERARDTAGALAAALGVVLLMLIRLWTDPDFLWRDDLQTGLVGSALEIGRALSEGEWPLLSRNSWYATAFAGEMQYAVFSPLILALNWVVFQLNLPLRMTTSVLILFHQALLAAGVYLLARDYRMPRPLAGVVVLAASLNGYMLLWVATAWYPLLTSFAWLPFYWLATRRAARAPRARLPLAGIAASLYMLLAAGWPGTNMMAIILVVGIAIQLGAQRQWRVLARIVAANALGSALAAPQLLVMAEFVTSTNRTEMQLFNWGWRVPVRGLPGLILPTFTTLWPHAAGDLRPHVGIELAGGAVILAAIATALFVYRRDFLRRHRFELTLAALGLVLSVAPSVWMFKWSFRWLPLFFLPAALVAGAALAELGETAPSRTRSAGLWLGVLTVVALIAGAIYDRIFPISAVVGMATLAVAAIWLAVDMHGTRRARETVPLIACLATLAVAYAFVPENARSPQFQIGEYAKDPPPFRRDRTYIAAYSMRDLAAPVRILNPAHQNNALFRPGNLPMAADLDFIGGYSPLSPWGMVHVLGFEQLHGMMSEDSVQRLVRLEMQQGALLDHMSVEGVTMSQSLLLRSGARDLPGWRLAAAWGQDMLLERRTPPRADVYFAPSTRAFKTREEAAAWIRSRREAAMPWVVVGQAAPPGCADARVESSTRLRHESNARIDTRGCPGEVLLVFARPWVPGFVASLDGKELAVETADLIMPAVRVPAGSHGELTLEYKPRSLAIGAIVALVALLLAAVAAIMRL
jgi:hypothetical protein